MGKRIELDAYFLKLAEDASLRSTCARRQVGAIAVCKNNYVVSTGHNGVPSGQPHCTDIQCEGAIHKSGEGLSDCLAIHAEQNLIAHCRNPQKIRTVYCTVSPCIHCVKLLAATPCSRIVFSEIYPHSTARDYWMSLSREWVWYQDI